MPEVYRLKNKPNTLNLNLTHSLEKSTENSFFKLYGSFSRIVEKIGKKPQREILSTGSS
jgi:hypothetical protein